MTRQAGAIAGAIAGGMPEAGRREISDEMVEADVKAYRAWDRRFDEEEGLVIAVFEAMAAIREVLGCKTEHPRQDCPSSDRK